MTATDPDPPRDVPPELKLCPFCGGRANIFYGVACYDGTFISCDECDVRTESYKTKGGSNWDVEAAVAAWNRRADLAPAPAGVTQGVDLIGRLTKLRAFLDGSGALNGHYFGERPDGEPAFWWRAELSPIDDAQAALTPQDAAVAALIEAVLAYKAAGRNEMIIPTDRGGQFGPKGQAIIATMKAKLTMFAALAAIRTGGK